jgi:hypothetical protein
VLFQQTCLSVGKIIVIINMLCRKHVKYAILHTTYIDVRVGIHFDKSVLPFLLITCYGWVPKQPVGDALYPKEYEEILERSNMSSSFNMKLKNGSWERPNMSNGQRQKVGSRPT